jgi:hypothetical protein
VGTNGLTVFISSGFWHSKKAKGDYKGTSKNPLLCHPERSEGSRFFFKNREILPPSPKGFGGL